MELLEEAVHLLRLAPMRVLACYYIGTLPFLLGFLFFWADMSRSAFALERCVAFSLLVAALFVWMKSWQAIFAGQLRAHLIGQPLPGITLKRLWRVAAVQGLLQPTAFLLLPIAAIVVLPLGWVLAFYQNLTVIVTDERHTEIKPAIGKALEQMRLWPRENHFALLLLVLFAGIVFINLVLAFIFVPDLLRALFGIDTPFTVSVATVANTTFLAVVASLTYLCVDPIVKSFYMLRCFYGFSLETGEDLRLGLRRAASPAALPAAACALIFLLAGGTPLAWAGPGGASSAPTSARSGVYAEELDEAIEQVLQRREYTWRLPREPVEDAPASQNWLDGFMTEVRQVLTNWMIAFKDWIVATANRLGESLEWLLRKIFGERGGAPSPGTGGAVTAVIKVLLVAVLAVAVAAAAVLLARAWRRRGGRAEVLAQAVASAPDLNDESVSADQLPEDGWLKLAREWLEKGDFRLALRAFYLAGLAHLARRDLIRIARFKSNSEYQQELLRRARTLPELQDAFAQNVAVFERVWYGTHPVTEPSLQQFQSNLERIQAC